MNELALFAGTGGGILGAKLLGWRTVCAVEIDAYAAGVLAARQNDGCLPPFPIWDDVETFDGRRWRGVVDVVSGGFPCQDISSAGSGAGIDGRRSGLWREFARIIGEVGPRYVLVENSPVLTSRGLGRVLSDLATLGYDAKWGVLGAIHAGAPHKRERIWIVAHAQLSQRRPVGGARERLARTDGLSTGSRNQGEGTRDVDGRGNGIADTTRPDQTRPDQTHCLLADSDRSHEQRELSQGADAQGRPEPGERPAGSCGEGGGWWESEPDVGRVADGVASRVDRLKCTGNGQVPAVVRLAWEELRP